MGRNEPIKMCRYYSGEEVCPFKTDNCKLFWWAESVFVFKEGEINQHENQYYSAIGGKDYQGIPRGILINLFFLWGKGVYDKKGHLSEFYILVDDYLEIASDHYPKDEIPC